MPFLKRAATAGVTIVWSAAQGRGLVRRAADLAARSASGRPTAQITVRTRSRSWPNAPPTVRPGKEIACTIYGQAKVKTTKAFLATYRPAGGLIRVVLVREEHGWLPLCSAHGPLPHQRAGDHRRRSADRATIEQDFLRREGGLEPPGGAGQQQVRNIWTNVAVYQMNLWMHTLVELWAWNRPRGTLEELRP